MTWFHDALADLPSADGAAAAAVADRASNVLRPLGALRRLDDVAVHVAGWQASSRPAIERPAVLVFAGDHGVAAAGVSAYPTDVTAAMLAAVRADVATVNAMARSVGASVTVLDVGVGEPTGDIRVEAALTPDRMDRIATVAAEAVDATVRLGTDLLVLGELGIGNTTVAAAVLARLLGGDATGWVGRGTGIDDDGLARKRDAVDTAVARTAAIEDPIEVLRQLGGSELVAMAAALLRARRHRVPVVLDGFVAAAAAAPLQAVRADALDHCLFGHVSAEPGHRRSLEHLAARTGGSALLDLDLRLGEGSGALAAVPIVRMACACVTEVPTFDEWFGGGT